MPAAKLRTIRAASKVSGPGQAMPLSESLWLPAWFTEQKRKLPLGVQSRAEQKNLEKNARGEERGRAEEIRLGANFARGFGDPCLLSATLLSILKSNSQSKNRQQRKTHQFARFTSFVAGMH